MATQGKHGQIEVSAEGILPVLRAITASALSQVLLERHGLEDVQPGSFHPMDRYLELLHDAERRMPSVLRNIGRYIVVEANFPEGMTFDMAVMGSDDSFYRNHRGCERGDIGHYTPTKRSDTLYHVKVTSPYPCSFDQGIYDGMAAYFGRGVTITHADDACRSSGADHCEYVLALT